MGAAMGPGQACSLQKDTNSKTLGQGQDTFRQKGKL
jgi:hypothetical protein